MRVVDQAIENAIGQCGITDLLVPAGNCPDETKFQVVERIAAQFRQAHNVIEIDGVRILFDRGWGLVRASNTQPVLVLRFEAEEESLLEKYRAEVEGVLEQVRRATV